jgi:methanogenic corrinoid protein MtbC1
VHRLRDHETLRDTRIMVGGFAFRLIPDLWKSTGADGSASDAADAISLAQSWFN